MLGSETAEVLHFVRQQCRKAVTSFKHEVRSRKNKNILAKSGLMTRRFAMSLMIFAENHLLRAAHLPPNT